MVDEQPKEKPPRNLQEDDLIALAGLLLRTGLDGLSCTSLDPLV